MSTSWNEAKIRAYISDKVEESLNLDYKAAGALSRTHNKPTEITKDVSAFLNSAGGTIIYGLQEGAGDQSHMPEKIDPIDRRDYSKEWLEHIISHIQPRPNVTIYPVQLASAPEHVAYVVEIPKGTTAYQAEDCKYYKRFNFESVALRDFEVRDIMRRRTDPLVETHVRIIVAQRSFGHRLHWRLKNESDVLARSVCTIIEVPYLLSGHGVKFHTDEMLLDEGGYTCWRLSAFNDSLHPLFPRGELRHVFTFDFVPPPTLVRGEPLKARDVVRFTTYADEMPPIKGVFQLRDIMFEDRF